MSISFSGRNVEEKGLLNRKEKSTLCTKFRDCSEKGEQFNEAGTL